MNNYMPFRFYRPYRPYIPPRPMHQSQVPPPQPQSPPVHQNTKSDDSFLFDIFGIKLFFDDVLILSLLFFLYKEEVKDEGLFLALVLLLIS